LRILLLVDLPPFFFSSKSSSVLLCLQVLHTNALGMGNSLTNIY
jgi:hypothetical protein